MGTLDEGIEVSIGNASGVGFSQGGLIGKHEADGSSHSSHRLAGSTPASFADLESSSQAVGGIHQVVFVHFVPCERQGFSEARRGSVDDLIERKLPLT